MSLDTKIVQEFQQILNSNRLNHAYLFEGGNYKQRHELALFLVKSQFCPNLHDNLPCLECSVCQTIDLNDNPDVLEIKNDKRSIGVDEVKEYKKAMSTSTTQGDVKVLIINDAQKLTAQAANNLLKFIEEPEGQVLIILLTDSKNQILPTILSRVQSFTLSTDDQNSLAIELNQQGFSEKNMAIVQATTELKNVQEMSDEEFSHFLEVTINWFKKYENNDATAFIDVQSKIKNLVDSREKQELFWSIVEKLFSDELSFKYDLKKQVILGTDVNPNLTVPKLTQQIDSYLGTVQKWKSNVSFQACLESLTLD